MLNNSAFLLLLSGLLIGANFPLGKIAGDAGVSPILWPLLISLGATLAMGVVLAASRQLAIPSVQILRFSVLSGLISFVAANLLVFALIPLVGSGYVGLMFATSPVFTLALAIAFRFKPPSMLGIMGIAVGFLGACLVAVSRQAVLAPSATGWLLVAFCIPLTLAIGNIYRTIGWPEGASPDVLAFWTNIVASLAYVTVLLVVHQDLLLDQLLAVPWTAALQLLVGGLTFPVYFRLQKFGGPVLLSQLGYIAAAVGLVVATVFLGERYPWPTWIGAAIIVVGIGLTIRAQVTTPQ